MYSLVENLVTEVKSFLDQRDFVALSVACTESETPVVWKTLEAAEAEVSSELFWMFQEPFVDAPTYVATIVAGFKQRHNMVRLLQPEQDMEQWPEFPQAIEELTGQPIEQLKELMRFSRQLLPEKTGFGSVWVFYPFSIESSTAYSQFLTDLLRHEFPFPWFSGLRVIFRNDSRDAWMAKRLSALERTRTLQVDFSSAALNRTLEQEINDDTLPLERQMQNVMVSAGIDFSHRRYSECLDKYALLFRYHAHTGDRAQLAVALNGIGETQMAMGHDDAARDSFLSALLPASEGEHFPVPVMTNILLNLAQYYEKHLHWTEAEGCLHQLQSLAALQRNPQLKVLMLERLGIAQHAQGRHDAAIETWLACESVSAQLDVPQTQESVLQRLRSAYLQKGDAANASQMAMRLHAIKTGAHDV